MDEYYKRPLDRTLVAMADATRRAILVRLMRGDACITEIARPFPISLNSVSKHVRMLEKAGLVRRSVEGREHRLSFDGTPLVEAAEFIDTYRTFWEGRLDARLGGGLATN